MQNHCLQAFHQLILDTWASPFNHVTFIYDHTLAESMLRQFVVESIALTSEIDKGQSTPTEEDNEEWNTENEFLLDMVIRVYRTGGPEDIAESRQDPKRKWRELDICKFFVNKERASKKIPPALPKET